MNLRPIEDYYFMLYEQISIPIEPTLHFWDLYFSQLNIEFFVEKVNNSPNQKITLDFIYNNHT